MTAYTTVLRDELVSTSIECHLDRESISSGAPVTPRPALSCPMNADLGNVIPQAIAMARAAGRDYVGQTQQAVRAVQCARPDMTAPEALSAVYMAWRS